MAGADGGAARSPGGLGARAPRQEPAGISARLRARRRQLGCGTGHRARTPPRRQRADHHSQRRDSVLVRCFCCSSRKFTASATSFATEILGFRPFGARGNSKPPTVFRYFLLFFAKEISVAMLIYQMETTPGLKKWPLRVV